MKSTPLTIGLVVTALLAAGVAGTIYMWRSVGSGSLTGHGWTALVIGVILSVVIGVGLMVLLFASSRRGHDETTRWE